MARLRRFTTYQNLPRSVVVHATTRIEAPGASDAAWCLLARYPSEPTRQAGEMWSRNASSRRWHRLCCGDHRTAGMLLLCGAWGCLPPVAQSAASGLRSVHAAYLQKTIYYLSPHIVFVGDIEITFQEAEDAFRYAVVGLQIFGCSQWLTRMLTLGGLRLHL
jgi:hypothetical protein